MISKQEILAFRKMILANVEATKKLIRVDELDPEELEDMIDLYEAYEVGRAYEKDEIFQYQGKLYKVLKGLTSSEEWKPDSTPSEYLPLMPEGVIPEWVQPTGAHDAYTLGDKVVYNSQVWASTVSANTWKPGEYGWELVE